MPSDTSDNELEQVVRRAVRAELAVIGERLFWTLVATIGVLAGLGLTLAGFNSDSQLSIPLAAAGVSLAGLAVYRLLWAWDMPLFGKKTVTR
ncbi:hypothetical protein [Halorussus halophilus]|uniref:hypothetical protein n=1 Tax=Halorussus halophilus TaxID=2650975 RepID=UPI0013016BA3|nr:hypothetical protein [Halorussus halophilus]